MQIRFCIVFLFLLQYSILAEGQQTKTNLPQQEVWPEVDGYYKINRSLRLMAAASATRAETNYADGALALNLDYFALPGLRKFGQSTDLDSTRGYFQWLSGRFKIQTAGSFYRSACTGIYGPDGIQHPLPPRMGKYFDPKEPVRLSGQNRGLDGYLPATSDLGKGFSNNLFIFYRLYLCRILRLFR